ncbi:GNAT family N-acetyltransferase [Streptomyces sp. MB22_4]|uniref:GNAT family N-acetyltransferase n=1 Tax=Streptomyces sp. MB22_4 TaxID=3383120 RepID=UPI0039A1A250
MFAEHDPEALRTLMRWKSAQSRRTGRTDRISRPRIVALVDESFRPRAIHCTGCSPSSAPGTPGGHPRRPPPSTVLAARFTVRDPELHWSSPVLMMPLRLAEAAARRGVRLMDLGRGDKGCEDWLKTRELRAGEGLLARPRPVALAHRLWRRPVRGLRNTVPAHRGRAGPSAGCCGRRVPRAPAARNAPCISTLWGMGAPRTRGRDSAAVRTRGPDPAAPDSRRARPA